METSPDIRFDLRCNIILCPSGLSRCSADIYLPLEHGPRADLQIVAFQISLSCRAFFQINAFGVNIPWNTSKADKMMRSYVSLNKTTRINRYIYAADIPDYSSIDSQVSITLYVTFNN
mgnify:CR=1 FL=1